MNTRFAIPGLLVAVLCATACHYGPSVKHFPPAHSPYGVTAAIQTTHLFLAELIEIRDADIVVLLPNNGKFELIPFTAIESLDFSGKKTPRSDIGRHRLPSPETREYLRLVSRFPQGLRPELLLKLLEANGQTKLAEDEL